MVSTGHSPIPIARSPHVPDLAKTRDVHPPGCPFTPQLLSPLPPPKPGHERDWGSSRTKLVPLKILPVAPRNASLSGSEFLAPGAITGSSGSAQNIFVRQCQALAQTRPGLEQRVPARPLRVPAGPWGAGWAPGALEWPLLGNPGHRGFGRIGGFQGARPSPVTLGS